MDAAHALNKEINFQIIYSPFNGVITVIVFNQLYNVVQASDYLGTTGSDPWNAGGKAEFVTSHRFWGERMDMETVVGIINIPYKKQMYWDAGGASAESGGVWFDGAVYSTYYSTGMLWRGGAGDYLEWKLGHLEAGSYLLIISFIVSTSNSVNTFLLDDGTTNLINEVSLTSLVSAVNQYIIRDFTVFDNPTSECDFRITNVSGGGFVVDHIQIVPVANSHSFPLDRVHQWMSKSKVTKKALLDAPH
jgi:hypothetical protein